MCWLPAQGKAKTAFYKLADDNDGVCFEWIRAESIMSPVEMMYGRTTLQVLCQAVQDERDR